MTENKTNKCECGKIKKPWFPKCFECIQKDKLKPSCNICHIEVPEGHDLCKKHWKEQQDAKKKVNVAVKIQKKVENNYRDTYEGKYYFNGNKFKSKSELIIAIFLKNNNVDFIY